MRIVPTLFATLLLGTAAAHAATPYEQAFAAFTRETSEESVRQAVRTGTRLVGLHIALGEPAAVHELVGVMGL